MRAIPLRAGRMELAAMAFGFSILMGLLAQVSVPLPFTPVPLTGQTFGVLLAGAVLGGPAAAAAMLIYLAEGLAGLPVFSAGGAGPAYLLGPTGGFLASFPLAAFTVGVLAARTRLVFALIAGEVVIFFFGALWLALWTGGSAAAILSAAVLPFLPGEIIKIALVLALAAGFRRRSVVTP